ncbi:carbohydrate porin [Vibrio hannami]|uniref:carbohydrate porin n=1 Tax=Vibrio hannami TaxID=2717094 RepID=UPI00240EC0D0|nr:carbohydrate porin [Vibrio hannami]MDG3085322.1 carbohydrate porin [Vibrio hannami]
MKKSIFVKSTLAALVLSSMSAMAADQDFEMHGYAKSGLLLNSDGNRSNSLGLFTNYGKFRLGNEQNTKIELLPTMKFTTDSGTWAKFRANLTHETNCTADWNCTDADGHDAQFREGYVEMGNLPFAPDAVFWAGKRYSSSNTSNHQYDWEYVQYNGTGGGVDKIDVGFAKMDVGLYAFMPSDRNNEAPVDDAQQGYPDDLSLNLWLKGIAGTGLDLQFVAHKMNEHSWHAGAAEDGIGLTAMYNFDGFYGITGGYSRIVAQYGQGLAAGDSLGKNGWGFANTEDTTSSRIVFDGLANVAQNWEVSTFAFYQTDSDYAPWSDWSSPSTKGSDRNIWAVGVRPHNQITENFAMQYEVGYEYIDEKKDGGAEGGLFKATIAPTIMLETGFWARPQIRVFATYAQWDDDAAAKLDSGYTRDGATDVLNFGVQAEVWF